MNSGNLNCWSEMKALGSCGYNPQSIRAARWHTVPSWEHQQPTKKSIELFFNEIFFNN